MKTRVVIHNDKVELAEEKRAEKRNQALGTHTMKDKPTRNVSRFMNKKGLTKNVKSGRMKRKQVDKSLASFDLYRKREISFSEMVALQEVGE